MSVELGRCVSIHGPGCVMLEFGRYELARGFGDVIATDPRLCVSLKFGESSCNGGSMGLADALIAANQRRQRDGLWRGKGRIPSSPVFYRLRGCAVRICVLLGLAMPDHLFVSLRMPSFGQTGEVLWAYCTDQAHPLGESSLPFARDRAALFVIALRLGGEFQSCDRSAPDRS